MTSYLTFPDSISSSSIDLKKMRVKILTVALNGGIWSFQGQGHVLIFFLLLEWHLLLPNSVVWDISHETDSAAQAEPLSKIGKG